jgi:N-acetyl-alpha-D-glucosaminyl L-malate synthase BshA
MAEVALSYDLDVLHVHYAIPHAACAWLAKQMLAPRPLGVVTTLHGTDITLVGNQPIFQRLTRFSIDVGDRVTAVSHFLERETVRTFETERDIRVIHNFVDCDRFVPRADAELRRRFAAPDEAIVMHASNFRPVKNVGMLIDVFGAVQRQVPARLVLIGEGPEVTVAKRRVRDLDLQERVLFMGNQEGIEELLPLADLFLLPSHHESFGLAALEAMACGTVVIATNVGGTREVIDDGTSGFLLHPADVSAWSRTAVDILRDPERRRRLEAQARSAATERFCPDRITAAYEEEYEAARDLAHRAGPVR